MDGKSFLVALEVDAPSFVAIDEIIPRHQVRHALALQRVAYSLVFGVALLALAPT